MSDERSADPDLYGALVASLQTQVNRLQVKLEAAEHKLACIAAVTTEDTDVGRYARLYFKEHGNG